jgi:hypothetical protein
MNEPSDAPAARTRASRWVDVVSTVLLALATVATAWASYQASRWHGEQAKDYARANAARVESTRASGLANRQVEIDVATFIQWVDAHASGDAELAAFYRRRFRPEFKPAADAWFATKPLENPRAPLTPFAMPQYRLASLARADRLEAMASAAAEEAKHNVDRANRYVLCVVLFAMSLFFAGVSTRLRTERTEAAVLLIGCIVFVATVVWVATFPVSFDF